MVKINILSLTVLILTSCASFLPQSTVKEAYILGTKDEQYCQAEGEKRVISAIIENGSPDYLLSTKILFKRGKELGSYQFAEWSEVLSQRVTRLIEEKLRCAGFIVGNTSKSDLTSSTIEFAILEFTHQADKTPGSFKAIIRIKLENENESKEKLFTFEQNVQTYDVSGVSEAADEVIAEFLIELLKYVDRN